MNKYLKYSLALLIICITIHYLNKFRAKKDGISVEAYKKKLNGR